MTMKRRLTFALLLKLILVAAASDAATLFPPPLVPDGDNVLDCYLVYVSGEPRVVYIQVLNRDGVAVVPPVETTLHPGHEDVARATADLLPWYSSSW